jgi:hypothetical protein
MQHTSNRPAPELPGARDSGSGADLVAPLAALAAGGGALAVVGALDLAVRLGHDWLRSGRRVEDSSHAAARSKSALGLVLLLCSLCAESPTLLAAQDAAETPAAVPLEPAEDAGRSDEPDEPDEPDDPADGADVALQPAPLPREPEAATALRPGQLTRTTEAARAFQVKLRDALLLEADAQAYEQATLGLEDPESLTGYRLGRRLRLDEDRLANERGRGFALLALVPPRPADVANAKLSRREVTLLMNLGLAYERARSDPSINQYATANSSFLQTANWGLRDRAVVLRDKLVARETGFTRLIEQANELLAGTVDEGQLKEMEQLLAEIAPETREETPDLSVLVIQDEQLRMKVLTELQVKLAEQADPTQRPPPATTLFPRVSGMQHLIVERANLAPVIQEHMAVEVELEQVEADLRASVNNQDIEARKLLTQRKAELTGRHSELGSIWFSTEPDPEIYPALVQNQDALIRRSMLDLGPRGALYGARYDVVRDLAATPTETSQQRWVLLQAQEDLLASLYAATADPDPLDGMLPLAALVKARPPPPPPVVAQAKPPAKPVGAGSKAGAFKAAPKPKKAPPKAKPKAKAPPPKKKPAGGKQPR